MLTVLSLVLPLVLDTIFESQYVFDSASQLCSIDPKSRMKYYKYIPSAVLLMFNRFLTWLEKDEISVLKAKVVKHEERLSGHDMKHTQHEERLSGHENLNARTVDQVVINTNQLVSHDALLEEQRCVQRSNGAYNNLLQQAMHGSDDEAPYTPAP